MHGRRWMKAALMIAAMSVVGCASKQQKARKEQQQKVIQTAKFYCEYLNGEQFYDIDVALNVTMGQRCDPDKPFSISQYRTPSDIQGVMYCCSTSDKMALVTDKEKGAKPAKKDEPTSGKE